MHYLNVYSSTKINRSQSTNNRTNDHQNHGEVVQINNHLNSTNSISNVLPSNSSTGDYVNDVEMENGHIGNGNSFNKNGTTDTCNSLDVDEDMGKFYFLISICYYSNKLIMCSF